MAFKVGDTVTVRNDLVSGEEYFMKNSERSDTFMEEMRNWMGKKVVILSVDESGEYYITANGYSDGGVDWCWTDEMFEECFENK